MADFYMDTDGGSDASNGTTWSLAKLTMEGLLAVMSAGDRAWIQGATTDTGASNRTFTSPGVFTNPCILTGVVDGTSNEPPVLSDLAATLPKIDCTGSGTDIITNGVVIWNNLHLSISDKFLLNGEVFSMVNCKLSLTDEAGGLGLLILEACEVETLGGGGMLQGASVEMRGGSYLFTASSSVVDTDGDFAYKSFTGVDFSGLGTTAFISGVGPQAPVTLRNCRVPSVFNLYGGTPDTKGSIEVINCSDTTSQGATTSIQNYRYEDPFGTIELELTAVRTDGADDGASGAFAYAMTTRADSTLESSGAALKSPEMAVWLEAGSNTLTIHIANDGAGDYNEDEVWIEFYTPDSGDTAQHDQTYFPTNARLFPSSTAITDDGSSSWGAGASNFQQLSITVTTGFEGVGYCRLYLAKRQATPDTLFLDPIPVVS